MRFVSPAALGLALALAGTTVVSAPAIAKDKKAEETKEPKRNYSKGFIAAVQPLQKAAQDKNYAAMTAAFPAAEAAVGSADDKFMLGNFRLQLGLGTNDLALQRTGIKEMLASGSAGPDEPKFNFFAGKLAVDAKDYDDAIPYLQKAADAGYEGSNSQLLLAEAQFQKAIAMSASANGQLSPAAKPVAQGGLAPLKRAIEIEKAADRAVPASWYSRGFSMAYLSSAPDAGEWAKLNLAADPSPKNWRTLLRSFQDANKQMTRGESLDLMRLMAKTGSLDSEFDYAEYAELASKMGLLGEVKSVIDQGRSSGKLGAGRLNDLYSQASEGMARDKASLASSEASATKAPTGKPAASTADAYLGYGDYAKAIALYKAALQKGSVDAGEINTRIGIALALSGDKAGAKSAFEQVSAAGARKQIVDYWLLWLGNSQAA